MKKIFLIAACAAVSGCQTVGGWADDVGSYMPVLSDERCEHWQCVTNEGKAQSDYNKQIRQQPPQNGTMPQEAAPPPPPVDTDPEQNPYDHYRP